MNIIRLKKFALEADVDWKMIEDFIIEQIINSDLVNSLEGEFSNNFIEWYEALPAKYFDEAFDEAPRYFDAVSVSRGREYPTKELVSNKKKWKESRSIKHKSKPIKRTIKP